MKPHSTVLGETNGYEIPTGALSDPALLPAPRVRPDLPAAARPRRKVLVVDDDAAMREMVEEFLRDEGYDVATAPNVLTGLIEALAGRPDVIVLDWKMPDLDGFRLLRSVEECTPGVPVIFVSGYIRPDVSLRALQLGAEAVLSKPFTLERLRTEIQDVLDPVPLEPGSTQSDERTSRPAGGIAPHGSVTQSVAGVEF